MNSATQDDRKEAIDSYITDMLALEKHIQTAVAGQIEDLDDAEVKSGLLRIHAMCAAHVTTLEAITERREQNLGGVSKVLKKAASSVLGLGAAAIDFVRTERLPKDLRDDYTAISLAYIGYLMLHTTSLSLGDAEVGETARVHMAAHAQAMMELQQIIPAATLAYLAGEGLAPDATVLAGVRSTISESWTR